MRWLLPFFLCLSVARSEWSLVSADKQAETAPGVEHYRVMVKDQSGSTREMDVAIFDSRKVKVSVFDFPSPDRPTLDAVMQKNGALAGVNGGYFHADYRPVGLVIADGKTVHEFEKAKLLSGVMVMEPDRFRILRSAEFDPKRKTIAALQAGPFLVDDGKSVEGLNDVRRAKRTLVATDGRHRHALIITGSLTLKETADILAQLQPLPEMKVTRALNLDGGSSTGIWVARPGTAPYQRAEWNAVRNFVGLVKR